MKTDGMRFHKIFWIPGLLVVSALSGCGLFGSKSTPMTSDQQMAAFIAHEHKTRAADQSLLLPGQIAAQQGRPAQAAALWQRCVNAAPYSDAGKKAQQLLLQHG